MNIQKPWLLMSSARYYPESGTSDWVGFYETKQEEVKKNKS